MKHEESRLQQQCVAWFRAQYPEYAMLLVHPINEGSGHTTMDRRRQGIHKAEGAVAGVPDLILFIPSGEFDEFGEYCYWLAGLGLELKTKTGRQSQEQKDFQKMFEAARYKYVIIRSLEDFQKTINAYLSMVIVPHSLELAATHAEITKAAEEREKEKFYKVIGKK